MTFRSNKHKAVTSTPFSDFIRNASSGRKKRVYKSVLEIATESQKRVMRAAEQRRAKLCPADADRRRIVPTSAAVSGTDWNR